MLFQGTSKTVTKLTLLATSCIVYWTNANSNQTAALRSMTNAAPLEYFADLMN